LPPLRERREDIPELVQYLFRKVKERHGLASLRLGAAVNSALAGYRWPGNVRELENVIERIVVLAASEEVTDADLPEEIRTSLPPVRDAFLLDLPEQGISLEAVERELLMRALEKFNGNQTQAARYLDISRRTLIYRMEKHGLSREGEVA
jgi:two-component system NtrC family response regulator